MSVSPREFSQPGLENRNNNPENLDFRNLTFEQLKSTLYEIAELAKKTFKQTENGFENINEKGIWIQKTDKGYGVSQCLIPEFGSFILGSSDSILYEGSPDKEKMMRAIEKMIKELGFRIIE